MKKYLPAEIEQKWQQEWTKQSLYDFDPDAEGEKYYNLVELPYTSGDLHLGHWFTFSPPDAHARYKRMKGFNIFYPVGFDAFGLPAENAAIKRGLHPQDWTMENTKNMLAQFQTMGTMINWDHQLITCSPEYYKWNQWIFIKMYEKGIAYLDKALLNWCPVDQTVLADENIEGGKCWRCGSEVVKKEVDEWFIKLTAYADRLIWPEKPSVDWPASVKMGQNNWIGKSEGMILDFDDIKVFTTRPETTDAATFLVLAPEHPAVKRLTTKEQRGDVERYVKAVESKNELERKENKEKTGIFTGGYVTNPVSGKKIPVWVADYVLFGYGTGAIMAVPGEDQRDRHFAQKFDLPIQKSSLKAEPKGEKRVNYHIRDWSISRQRYWGTPVPMIHCKSCGIQPVPLEDLPVELPYEVDFTPKGKPPLATNEEWMKVKCPKCGEDALRDPQTLDGFFDNSWYFMRYIDPKNDKAIFDARLAKKLLPVDIYFGGAEHTLGHTLYARFFTRFFKELGLIDYEEFALKRVQHGVVLGPDGARMSKSRGNVVNPDEVVKEYGADTVRLYLCFMMPYIDTTAPWSTGAIAGIYRFLRRIWELSEKVEDQSLAAQDQAMMHKTIKKVGEDIEQIHFNTAVASLMEWLNYLSAKPEVAKEEYWTFLKLLAPFAPHITEELWQTMDQKSSIHLQKWPEFDQKFLELEQVKVVVQVNGKVRDELLISKDMINSKNDIESLALKSPKVVKFLGGKQPQKSIYVPGKILNLVV